MGVIYLPEPERKPQRPVASADSYLLGTQWMSDDGSIWEVEWDNQDKRHMWVLLTNRTICTCASAYGEFIGCKLHGIEADDTNRTIGASDDWFVRQASAIIADRHGVDPTTPDRTNGSDR